MNHFIFRKPMTAAAVLGCGMLAGCASYAPAPFAARVTTFEQWPANVQHETYHFGGVSANEAGRLEYRNYEDIVRANLGRTGLVEAKPWDRNVRFTVSFSYGTEPFQTWAEVESPYAPFPYGYGYGWPYGPMSYGYYGWGGRSGLSLGMAIPFGGYGYRSIPVTASRYTFEVSIRDARQNNAEVYQARAVHESDGGPDELTQIMPYLVQSVFDGFPQNNGQTRTVRIPRGP